jgi:hypothetical protein
LRWVTSPFSARMMRNTCSVSSPFDNSRRSAESAVPHSRFIGMPGLSGSGACVAMICLLKLLTLV